MTDSRARAMKAEKKSESRDVANTREARRWESYEG